MKFFPLFLLASLNTLAQYSVTFQVNANNIDTDWDGIFAEANDDIQPGGIRLTGDWMGWDMAFNSSYSGPSIAMDDANNDGIWTVVINFDLPGTYHYVFINGTAMEYWGSNSCNLSSPGSRVINVQDPTVLLPATCFNSCSDVGCNPTPIHFEVNMSNQIISAEGVFLYYGFDYVPMTDLDGDLIYEVTRSFLPRSYSYEYIFVNGTEWELPPTLCNVGNWRLLTVDETPQTVQVCFNECFSTSCSPSPGPSNVIFSVDLTNQETGMAIQPGAEAQLHYINAFGETETVAMSNVINNIYEASVYFESQPSVYFYFGYNDGITEQLIDADCSVSAGLSQQFREYNRTGMDAVLPVVCWESCDLCVFDTILGCTEMGACNFSNTANVDDGSCYYDHAPCDDQNPGTAYDMVWAMSDCGCFGSPFNLGDIFPQYVGVCDQESFEIHTSDPYWPTWSSMASEDPYQFAWFYQQGEVDCPTGADTSQWQSIPNSDTTFIEVNSVEGVWTYACFFIPESNSGIQPQWIEGCRVVNVSNSYIPEVTVDYSNPLCSGGTAQLTVVDTSFDFVSWSTGETGANINVSESGYYSAWMSSSITSCGVHVDSVHVNLEHVAPVPICLVTVDPNSGNNVIVWEPIPSSYIMSYDIEKETQVAGVFEVIGSIDYGDDGAYTDPTSNSSVQASRYKLSLIDSCGNAALESETHKTIHLTSNIGLNNTVNLIWSHYEGITFGSYNIYRGNNTSSMTLLTTIASNLNSYTDLNPLSDSPYYVVEVEGLACDSSRSTTVAWSNIIQNTPNVVTDIRRPGLSLYPNPADDYVILNCERLMGENHFAISDIHGQQLMQGTVSDLSTRINISSLPSGVYSMKFQNKFYPIIVR